MAKARTPKTQPPQTPPPSPPISTRQPMAVHVLTNRYNSARTGANMAETLLDTKNVAVTTFGKLFHAHG